MRVARVSTESNGGYVEAEVHTTDATDTTGHLLERLSGLGLSPRIEGDHVIVRFLATTLERASLRPTLADVTEFIESRLYPRY